MTPPADTTDALLEVRDLEVEFRIDADTTVRAVKGVSFDVPANATVALVGESGSGKSVTALAIMSLLPPENARARATAVSYRGRDLLRLQHREMQRLRGRELAMIFQEPMTSLNPVFTIGFQIEEVLTRHLGLSRRQARQRAVELLEEVGIPEPQTRMHAYPFQLSGGQQQRAMIAIAIACEPRLLIADEPTTALDVTIQKQILELLARLQKQHAMSVLFITHDLAIVRDVADEVIVMRDGRIRESGSVRQIFETPADPYTRALIACRPQLARRPARLPVIDDFMERTAAAPLKQPERTRGLTGDEPIVLEARRLTKTFYLRDGVFRKRALQAVSNASFTLAKGKTLGVVGESGSGKTTLALMLVRLQEPTNGEVLFEGRNLLAQGAAPALEYKRRIQIVFQNPYASLNPRFTAGQILVEPMQIHGIGADDRERRELAYAMLEKVGLPAGSFFKYPHEFSGGQRQRIAIARCLTLKPDILICDEAVSALDVSIQAQLLNLLQDLQDEYGMSYVFISHDLAVVKYMADEVIVMNRGEVVESAGSDQIYAAPQHPYTKALLASMPRSLRGPEPRDA
jgi:peptide/nickel transport system ATP-binding protein